MITEEFIHIGMGDTGEGMVRNAVQVNLVNKMHVRMVDTAAHRRLSKAQTLAPKATPFTFIRNPFDWYLSFYKHELMTQRYAGRFRWWFYGTDRPRGRPHMLKTWHYFTDPGIELVGKFENFKQDFIRIFAQVCSRVSEKEVESWFPAVFAAWMGRPWIEGIEQWYRDDCYTATMVDEVYIQDEEIFTKWGYTFEEKYDYKAVSS